MQCSLSASSSLPFPLVSFPLSRTILHQTAKITVHGVPLLGDLLERLFLHNYTSTVANVSPHIQDTLLSLLGGKLATHPPSLVTRLSPHTQHDCVSLGYTC